MKHMPSPFVRLACLLLPVLLITPAGFADADPPSADEVLASVRPQAVDEVLAASRSDDAFLRANAIEAAQSIPDRILPLVELGLEDEHPAVRFAALMSIGKLELTSLADAAAALREDESPSVRAAALFAGRRCDAGVDISPLAAMLASPDPTLRGNVVMLLGELGDPSAIAMIQDLADRPMPRAATERLALIRLQAAEALLKLGDESALDAIRAGAYSGFNEVRVLAVQMLGRAQDRRMRQALKLMLEKRPIELQLAAAEALARMGLADGLAVTLEAAEMDIVTVRAQTAFTLGQMPRVEAARTLADLLEDSEPMVRVAAAAAVLRATQR
ncbi:MAG: HEAT repeat domain-containing protein [Phycisphaeraceae bacterium]